MRNILLFAIIEKIFSEDIDGKDEYEMESMAVNSQSKVMGVFTKAERVVTPDILPIIYVAAFKQ